VEGLIVFRALGDYTNRVIIEYLLERKMACVSDVHEYVITAEHVAISVSGLSHRMIALRQDGLIDFVLAGNKHYYYCVQEQTIKTLIKVVQIANAEQPSRDLVIA
jgi:DNA-binding transcriptional ArsR family regulator